MISLQATELLTAVTAFWAQNGKRYRESLHSSEAQTASSGSGLKEALSTKITWLCASFLFIVVGIETAVSGWVVTFALRIRHAAPFAAGMSSVGFWAGLTAGRVILGFVTPLLGERLAIFLYLASATVAHLIFWLVPIYAVSAVGAAFLGFFSGPFFPAAIVAASKLLPKHLHVGAIGFIAALGAAGATVLPFAVGAIAGAKGVQVLMPIVLALLAADAVVWALLPSLKGKPVDARHVQREEGAKDEKGDERQEV